MTTPSLDFSSGGTSGSSAGFSHPIFTNQQYRDNLGQTTANISNTLGIPHIGVSDWIAGHPVTPTSQLAGAEGGLATQPTNTSQAPTSSPANYSNGTGNQPSQLQQLAAIGNQRNPVQESQYQSLLAQQGPTQDQINQQITDTYNASNGYLDQAEQQLRSDYPTVQQDINGQYNTQRGQLDTSNQANLSQFNLNQQQADYGHESALAAARRLYSELRQGYLQRFGGSSSAGDAANQIANVEQQRQMGQTNQGYQQTLNQINTQRTNVENQYQQGIQALMTQRDTALNQANRDFQNKLLQISQSRAQNEAAKGQAKLQALQDLRNQIFAINQQNTQFQQTLEAQRQQAQLQLQNYQALAGQGLGYSNSAANAYGQYGATQPTSGLSVNDLVNGVQNGGLTLMGSIKRQDQQPTGQVTGGPDYQRYPNDGYSY